MYARRAREALNSLDRMALRVQQPTRARMQSIINGAPVDETDKHAVRRLEKRVRENGGNRRAPTPANNRRAPTPNRRTLSRTPNRGRSTNSTSNTNDTGISAMSYLFAARTLEAMVCDARDPRSETGLRLSPNECWLVATAGRTMEEWRSIPAFPEYQASSAGRLRRGDKLKLLSVDDKGYHMAFVAGRPRRVSRLVASAFLGFEFYSPILSVDHIDRNTLNDDVSNLRVATAAVQAANRDMTNIAKGKRLPVEQLDKATGAVVATHVSVQEAARAISKGNGGASAICNAVNGKSKSAYGYRWKYADQAAPENDDEEWRQFEDVWLSDRGRIKRKTVSGSRIYAIEDYGKDGRYAIATVKGRRWPVHRLMAVVFLDLPQDDTRRVAFKDGDPTNLVLDNIEVHGGPCATLAPSPTFAPGYLAGMFDGDGSVNMSKVGAPGKQGYLLKAELSQCNEAFLKNVNAFFGNTGKLYADSRTDKYTKETNHTLRFCGVAAKPVLEIIASHGIIKSTQAALALDFLDLPRVNAGGAKEAVRQRMKELNCDKAAYDKPWERMSAAYVAGLFDAEGHVHDATDATGKRRMYVKITQKSDVRVLDRIRDFYGTGAVADGCCWKIYSRADIDRFRDSVLPHLKLKLAVLCGV